eukprot:TRINITY_DN510_c0_g1_i1.p1 TRINITY_DN510_c0_g1~~TRINITY_DN510_c0_g1_i1.p1  ORF type:complete len:289 (+),score=8.77 TRINITY_DN510_c0_g1_i1:192-1058(+)
MQYNITEKEFNLLEQVFGILGYVSLGTSGFVVLSYFLFKRCRYPHSLVLFFSISTMFLSAFVVIAYGVGVVKLSQNRDLCTFQAAGFQFFGFCAIMWWGAITLNLYLKVIKNYELREKAYLLHIFCWGLPIITTFVPYMYNKFVYVGLWCWITDANFFLNQFIYLYMWMGVLSVLCIIAWIHMLIYAITITKKVNAHTKRIHPAKLMLRHVLFSVCFTFVFCFMFSHRLSLALGQTPPFGLLMTHVVCISAEGLLCFIVFGLKKEVIKSWVDGFRNANNHIMGYSVVN